MNWSALGAIAELLGAAGVIASLLYLATQMRQSLSLARVEAQKRCIASMREVTANLLADPELNALFLKGLDDWSDLPSEDQKADSCTSSFSL